MDWIKKNYDRFALLLIAVALLASSAFLILRANHFSSLFEALEEKIAPGSKLKEVPEITVINTAKEAVDKPASWGEHTGSLFVSQKYLVKDGKLVNPLEGGAPMLHAPVPNDWFSKNGLDLLESNVLSDDPDGDGFSVLDEYLGKTDPNDKNSHPPYATKLRLKRYIPQPFRLKFAAYDGDSFQINTLDLRQPSQFLKLGDPIAGTKFKLLKFEQKKEINPKTGEDRDISELTIENTVTQENVVLVVEKVVDSPESFALFKFLWDGTEFKVKKDQEFVLKVEPTVSYKLIDIHENEAVIVNRATEERIKIPALEEALSKGAGPKPHVNR